MFGFGKKDNRTEDLDSMDEFSEFEDLNEEDLSSTNGRVLDYGDDIDLDDDDSSHSTDAAAEEKFKKQKIVVIVIAVVIAAYMAFSTFAGGDDESKNEGKTGDSGTSQADGEKAKNTNPHERGDIAEGDDKSKIEGNTDGVNVTEEVGKTHSGTEDGNTSNGTGAILAFNYDYYVNRSGEEARKHFNPNTPYDGVFIQNEIDNVPEGTTYNLDITPVTLGDKYDVVLTINVPGEKPAKFNMNYQVASNDDGVFYVKEFTRNFSEPQSDKQ